MNIGILTFHRPANFGANLQAFCSSSYLKNLGHNVSILNYVRDEDEAYASKGVNDVQLRAHSDFVCNKLPITEEVRTKEELKYLVKKYEYDLIVVGADAVWRSKPNDTIFFLQWLFEDSEINNIAAVSMSPAHMGNGFKNLTDNQRKCIRRSLESFRYITTRDNWTKDRIIQDIFNGEQVDICINPDPVFMIDKFVDEDWNSFGMESKSYILMSLPRNWTESKLGFLYKMWFNRFKRIVNKQGYKLIELPVPEGKSGLDFDFSVDYPITPFQWYLWLKNAKAFCGLRFHAIVSCISAGTPFFSIDSYGLSSTKKLWYIITRQYRKAMYGDERSKIYDLLKGTCFEENRVDNAIAFYSPTILLGKLLNADVSSILELRNKRIGQFNDNMSEMIKIVKR